jgi:ribosomal protein L16/L10AE
MGKGKGALSRYCARILQNHNLFEFTGFTLRELLRLKRVFQKKLRIPAKINSNFFINKQYICPFGNENLYFFRKYEH